MRTYYPMIAAILAASMSTAVVAEEAPAEAAITDQPAPPTLSGAPRTPAEMQQRMQEMRQQHMQRMHANRQAMPMMGPRGGMRNPEMMQRMQEMRRQRMEMMQAGRPVMPGAPAAVQEPAAQETDASASAAPAAADVADTGCGRMHGRHGMHDKGMKKQMMAMRQQHMQVTEQRLANIENLMRELVDLLKNSR